LLTVENIHTYYGDSHILQGVSLQVRAGEAVALLGRNGAGKTTTIKSIVGFTPPRAGRVLFRERDITRLPSHVTANLGVGLVPQGRGVFPTLTVRENLTLAARGKDWTLERVLQTFPSLAARLNTLGARLSGGEQQLLAIGRALMTNPALLLLDEPSEGLAPLIVLEIGRILRALRDQGIAILLVEQNLSLALGVAERVYVMSKGTVGFEGAPAELQHNAAVMQRYLGV
jgi:branched-chain amino acid transport system ATP-binding protein